MSAPDNPVESHLEPADNTKYLLHSPNEILFVLRSMVATVDRVTVHFNEGRDFLLSSVLEVDEGGLTLDYGSNDEMNRRALVADKLYCVASHDKVRVQFLLTGLAQIVGGDGRPAFRAALPKSLLRLQRREYYRLTTPFTRPLKCVIPFDGPNGPQKVEVNVVDISGGGLAVMTPPAGHAFEPGMEFHKCRIELPEVGSIVSTLQVRNVFDVTLRNGAQLTRAGCQFVNLPGPMLTLVQRYIIKVERERKARETGMG